MQRNGLGQRSMQQRQDRLPEFDSGTVTWRRALKMAFAAAALGWLVSQLLLREFAPSSPAGADSSWGENRTYPPQVSIVVPTLREAPNIKELCTRTFASLSSAGITGEMIVVDDHSEDGIEDIVKELARSHPISIIVRPKGETGLSSAVMLGFYKAKYDILAVMDADLSHPPEKLPELVLPIANGSKSFTLGSRYVSGGGVEDWPLVRRVISLGATFLAYPLTRVKDPMSGFFALDTWTFDKALHAGIDTLGFKIGLELIVKSHVPESRILEVPIVFVDRIKGESKLSLSTNILYLKHLFLLFLFKLPILVPMGIGLLLGVFYMALVLAAKMVTKPKGKAKKA